MAKVSDASQEAGVSDLDRAKYELDCRRLALEESWPRKWGTIIISAAATLSVAGIAAASNLLQITANSASSQAAAEERKEQHIRDQSHRDLEDDRTALDMYFRYVADKPADTPGCAEHLKAIAAIAHDRRIIDQISVQLVSLATRPPDSKSPSDVLAGGPDVRSQTPGHVYKAKDFVSYVQYYAPRQEQSRSLTEALQRLGISVPGQQQMDERHSPTQNQIRIYRSDHRDFANWLGRQLKTTTGLDFQVVGPIGSNLPNGVIEIWLGRSG